MPPKISRRRRQNSSPKAAKLLAEGGKTSRRRRQNFVQTFGLQALQSKALYGGKTSCKPLVCKPYKAK
ncbi:hypothetical protein EON73_00400, partial [bacterium]